MEEVKTEGPKEMTLDEWKAMQDKERTKVEFNIRKPNEGTDSQWKKGYVLHKSKSEDVSVATLFLPAARRFQRCWNTLTLSSAVMLSSSSFVSPRDCVFSSGLLSCPFWLFALFPAGPLL